MAYDQAAFPYTELKRRYISGVCKTLVLEVLGQGTMDAHELANETTQAKRVVVFQRLAYAINRLPQPSVFLSQGGGGGGGGGGGASA